MSPKHTHLQTYLKHLQIIYRIVKNYHFADINLFWKDISDNSKIRVNKWLQMNK